MNVQKNARPKRVANVLLSGIENFILSQPPEPATTSNNVDHTCIDGTWETPSPSSSGNTSARKILSSDDLPKRYTFYEPMLLLGSTFLSHTVTWENYHSSLTPDQLHKLYQSIADAFCKNGHAVTHIAMNAPIQKTVEDAMSKQQDNIMRSPVNLQPLFGDFGPAVYNIDRKVTSADMEKALWVETIQVGGIRQVWAPRWTMFSRGNIREKSRVLGQQGFFPGLSTLELGEPTVNVDVVDFYIGIGYFAFCYLKQGVRTVFGWDINPWSIEGLRRGCEKNSWRCLVVDLVDDTSKSESIAMQIVEALLDTSPPRCVAFCCDNTSAAEIMSLVKQGLGEREHVLNVRHANLGLLPTSRGAWKNAVQVLSSEKGGWLHVHENAEISRVSEKRKEVLEGIRGMLTLERAQTWKASCENTEMVKTYAPGIGHYVFDIKLCPAR